MDYLADFLAATLGGALAVEITLLVGFVVVLLIRRLAYTTAGRRWGR